MKKNLMYGLVSAALVLSGATACSDDNDQPGLQAGSIKLLVDLDLHALNASDGANSRADGSDIENPEITAADLQLTLTPRSGGQTRTWASVNDFKTDEAFPVGDYTLAVSYGNPDDEGFGKPYYYGDADFRIRENETTPVAVTAALANSMVKIETTEAFQGYFSDASFTLHSEAGDFISYPVDTDESAYLKPGEVSVVANVTKPNGVGGSLEAAKFTAKPRYSYTVTVDINGGAGDATLVITYTENTTEEVVEIDLTDELLNAPGPEVTADGFEPETVYEIIDGLPEGLTPTLDIMARNGIAAVTMTTQSASLLAAGWPAEIDLVKAGDADQQKLQDLGLNVRGLFRNPDKQAIISLDKVVANIYYVPGAATDNKVTFVVKDKLGKMSEPVGLQVATKPIELSLGQPAAALPTFETSLTVPVSYNGMNIDNVAIYLRNNRGTFDKADDVVFAKTGDGIFNASFTVAADDRDVVIYAQAKDVKTPNLTIQRKKLDFALAVNNGDVFAKHAVLSVTADGEPTLNVPSTLKVQVAAADGSFTEKAYTRLGNDKIKIEGLDPATVYQARTVYSGAESAPCSFTTEAAVQLSNSNMDAWNSETKDNYDFYTCTGWGTLNELTTSVPRSGVEFSALSSTISTSDSRSGSAALLRSVGYDVSAKQQFLSNSNLKPKSYSQGELYIGTYANSNPYYGDSFESRPASLTFWYKYTPYNSADQGYAEISVLAADGSVIASGSANLSETSAYTAQTIALTYADGAQKAAKIKVVFRSTYDTDTYLKANCFPEPITSSWGTYYLNDYYIGSQLFIDDIELNY